MTRQPVSGFRWDADLEEFQYRCDECRRKGVRAYWPVSLEFWDPRRGMSKCRACWNEENAKRVRERYRTDPVWAERKRRANREAKRALNRVYHQTYYPAKMEAIRSDPERYEAWKARHREATARYRERLRQERAA